ncbi:MAG: lysophospholipid acyltransferase family protein [Gemmatimonadales bacterium]
MAESHDLSRKERFALWLQRGVSRVTSWFWIPASAFTMRFLLGYRIRNASRLRKRFRSLIRESDGPVLICANHLTMVDSALVAWALGGTWWSVLNFRWVPWNLPEVTNFADSAFARLATWLTKCIPIRRGGKREEVSSALRRVQHLLSHGDTALIFAEGGRSRTGRVEPDKVAHGMGRIASSVAGCKALCVYLRGDRQQSWSMLPVVGDSFYVDIDLFEPSSSEQSGIRRSRDFARQIGDRLARMEEKYFARRQRRS